MADVTNTLDKATDAETDNLFDDHDNIRVVSVYQNVDVQQLEKFGVSGYDGADVVLDVEIDFDTKTLNIFEDRLMFGANDMEG